MKNNKICILIIFMVSILIMLFDAHNGYIKGHDTDFHVSNISAIVDQLSWDNVTVQEPLKYMANDFGYGTRFFYPPIPHLLAAYIVKFLSIFHINSITIGMRITQWITFFTSGITFFFLAQKIFKNKKIATILALFYMTAPYHLSEIFIRDAFSEMFIPVAIPLIILGLLYLVEKDYKKFFLLFVGGYTLAIYSHIAMTVYFTLMLLVTFFIVYFKEIFTKKHILYLSLASVCILLLTASFWMPMLEIKLLGSYGVFMPYFMTGKGDLRFSAISILEIFKIKPYGYDNVRFHLQMMVIILFLVSIFLLFKNKLWKEKVWRFFLAFTILAMIMITSLFPWYYTPDLLQTLQFPWRLALYIAFGAIVITGIVLKKFENIKHFNKICFVLIALTIFGAYYYTGHLDETTVDVNNINYTRGVGNQAEYLPENTLNHRDYYENRTNDIIIESGTADITITLNDVPDLIFEVETNETITIELPRLYYMGYTLEVNGQDVELVESKNGFLQATISESGTYTLTYEKTIVMKIANFLSLGTFIILMIVIVFCSIRNKKKVYLLEEKNN